MTDEPPTDLGEVVITGQRARGPSPFAASFPTKGNGLGNEEQNEVDPDPSGGGSLSDEAIQCAIPEGRKQWNADAKAVQAKNAFLARAAQLHEIDLQIVSLVH